MVRYQQVQISSRFDWDLAMIKMAPYGDISAPPENGQHKPVSLHRALIIRSRIT